MSIFILKSQLPVEAQNKMDAILAIPAGQRTTTDAAFLTAIGTDYIYNSVISYDSSGNILQAKGITVPTGNSGFAKGATFIKTDAADKAVYENVGSTTVSSWNLMGQESAGDITLASGKILVGQASGTGGAMDLSGDATILPTGALTLTKFVKNEIWVDVNRTDTFSPDGSYEHPFITLATAITAMNAKYAAAVDKQTTAFTINLASGTYADAITLTTGKNIRFIGSGVVLSGAFTLTQSPIGGSGQEPYTRIEFIGTSGIRAEKGKGMKLAGAITGTRTNDSLTYINFKGCWISGTQTYSGDGTWVTQYENCRVDGAITTGAFTTPDSQVLVECIGWNEFAGAISNAVTFYNVDNTDFWGAVAITPYFDNTLTNTKFHSTVSIIAVKSLYIDAITDKSLTSRSPTLTGMTKIFLDLGTNFVMPTISAPVNSVASRGTLTVTGGGNQIAAGYTVTIGVSGSEKTYTFASPLTPTEGEVLVGATDTASLLNLKNALNHAGTPGTDYSCAAAHPTVLGQASTALTLVAEARVAGTSGNALVSTKTGAEISWDGAGTLGTTRAGVNGTVGFANQTASDGTYVYVAVAANTIADANWRRISLGSAY
jgi:hypothetical protein